MRRTWRPACAPQQSLAGLEGPLAALEACLGPGHAGQRFTGLARPHAGCAVLRSSSRHCANLGRQHNSNTVYFVVTREGVSQRCYCRCETTEGRAFGLCRDFRGPVLPAPRAALEALLAGGGGEAGGGGGQGQAGGEEAGGGGEDQAGGGGGVPLPQGLPQLGRMPRARSLRNFSLADLVETGAVVRGGGKKPRAA